MVIRTRKEHLEKNPRQLTTWKHKRAGDGNENIDILLSRIYDTVSAVQHPLRMKLFFFFPFSPTAN
jgi:hypothetical protein